jgi:GNAT superfamily N-acetyltransferase
MIDRVYEAISHLCRLIGQSADGGQALEPDGVLAAIVPAAPERSVVNSVVYRTPQELAAAYDEIASAYGEIGANWTVWVRPGDDAAARFLESRGHVLDAEPFAMVHDLKDVGRPPADALSDWTADGDLADVGPINDRAYGFGTDSFTRALGEWPDGSTHVYIARDEGRPVACLLMTDHERNSDLELVAVLPEARGRGLGGKLLGHALADAAERGNETSTLVATKLGYPVYERAGYRTLEQIPMWERRADA